MVARTKEGKHKEEGITLFLVDAKSPGIKLNPLKTMGSDKQFEVIFNKVKVPKKNILGKLDHGWAIIQDLLPKATLAQCASWWAAPSRCWR